MAAPKGNQHATKHGAEAALDRLTDGQPFTGLALDKQAEIVKELESDGVDSIVERNAIRLQTAADLYFEALTKAAQDGNEKLFDAYVGRFGWLTAKTLLAWQQVKANRKARKPALDGVLKDYADEPTSK
jgi:hypothetical protein